MSQRLAITTLENVVSNAERRALLNAEAVAVPRASDVYASLAALTGKIELEYEGELKGAEHVARELVRKAVATVFDGYATGLDTAPIIGWFNEGGSVDLTDTSPAADLVEAVGAIDGFEDAAAALGARRTDAEAMRAAVADFVLEGLCALKKISRTEEGRLLGAPAPPRPKPEIKDLDQLLDEDDQPAKGKKKYYN